MGRLEKPVALSAIAAATHVGRLIGGLIDGTMLQDASVRRFCLVTVGKQRN